MRPAAQLMLMFLVGARCLGTMPSPNASAACKALMSLASGFDGEDAGVEVEKGEMLVGAAILREAGCTRFVASDSDISARFDAFETQDVGESLEPDEMASLLATVPDQNKESLLTCAAAATHTCDPSAARRKLTNLPEELGAVSSAGRPSSESIEWKLGERLCCENNDYTLHVVFFFFEGKDCD
jgi:hypothetical protein